jgi:hypothetical protein
MSKAYDAIIVGPRAYETDSALVENNDRLLSYARRGGLVIVQYQQHQFFNGRFAPYPMKVGGQPLRLDEGPGVRSGGTSPSRPGPPISHDRVVDENAPVHILTAEHPAVRFPNRLSNADWQGWVQERGLYFARSWDRHYRSVLETHDPGDGPLEGGLLIAPVGKGTYVYTGLSFFRQLPAGEMLRAVPGRGLYGRTGAPHAGFRGHWPARPDSMAIFFPGQARLPVAGGAAHREGAAGDRNHVEGDAGPGNRFGIGRDRRPSGRLPRAPRRGARQRAGRDSHHDGHHARHRRTGRADADFHHRKVYPVCRWD